MPRKTFRRTLAYRPLLLRGWADGVVQLAERVQPQLVRCYGANVNAFAAAEIKRRLGIPFAVSLHINPDEDLRGRAGDLRERVWLRAIKAVERHALLRADMVLPVYQPIVPYLERLGVTRYRVAYNALNAASLQPKDDYRLHVPPRVISVGRQIDAKNPDNLIRAVASLPGVQLTLVGDGPKHEYLRAVARDTGADNRIVFHRAIANDALCRMLSEQDVFATHSEYWEVSKAVIEALLTGLPVVLNRRSGAPVPELGSDLVELVANTPEAYADSIVRLLADQTERESFARAAAAEAYGRWTPEASEAVFVDIYRTLMRAG
jgi:glycosyltransferase involved in cell wall biosynthesis